MVVLNTEGNDKRKLTDCTVEIIGRCMNKCIFCSSYSNPDTKEFLHLAQVRKVLSQAKDLGLKEVVISGGEPLLHPDLLDILKWCKKLRLKVALYTSGVVEDHEGKPKALREWEVYRGYIHRLVFIISSMSDYNRDLLYGRSNAFETMESLSYSGAARVSSLEANIIPNRTNLFGLKRLVKWLSILQLRRINFLRLVVQGRAFENRSYLVLSSAEYHILHEILDEIASMQVSPIRRFGVPFSYTGLSAGKCIAGESKLVILPSGYIVPCEAFKEDWILGHINTISLDEALICASETKTLKVGDKKSICIAQ